MNNDKDKTNKDLFIFPRKMVPPARGTKPLVGVAAHYARKTEAKRMMSDGEDSDGEQNIIRAMQVVAISQKATADGKRRQLSVIELERIVNRPEGD
ncbi:MAG: hypothetical protein K6F00_03820 [Lachnospiraceae bacterium]|nr:hypothetical protein [Lachnospiraceae bacterium]